MQMQIIELFIIFISAVIGIYTVVFTIKNNTTKSNLEIFENKLNFEREALNDRETHLNKLQEKNEILQLELKEQQGIVKAGNKALEEAIKLHQRDVENLREEKILNDKRLAINLEKISLLSKAEAKEMLFAELYKEQEEYIAKEIKNYNEELKLEKKLLAQEILISSMESLAVDTTNEIVMRTIPIPSEDIKGKLIGREGRNIRLLETLLGANVIIDDTPNTIFISCFNARRRAVAQFTLESLVNSGKINQITIEDTVIKAQEKVNDLALEAGRETIYKFRINDIAAELVHEIGIMQFRSSYGQNLLAHSIEAATIAAKIATELDLDPILAARCVLLHDIGKNNSAELGISHVEIGVKIARKYGESDIVINAIEAHHDDVITDSLYAQITIIADSMSASRVGARRDQFEAFIQRVESLEKIANNQEGVSRAFALQGGREIRVIVEASIVSDAKLSIIAKNIRDQIQNELAFPGIIKVRVIREFNVVEEASKEYIEGYND